ncbi:MAG: hypothetical protein FJ010_06135 [Chloroflexi bacterium]|nr:hypothetical protein [Chloroflexota bacterium]
MKQRLQIIIPLAIFTLAVAARLIPGPRTIDDSYITYRYARNILAGEGFVYNPDERVLGTTTPLYTLTLVAVGALTGGAEANFPVIALALNALADALTALLLWKFGTRLGYKIAGAAAGLVWAVAPFSVTFAIGGLETSLYVLLLTAAVYTHTSNRRILTALLASLSLLTRPDALLLLAPLGISHFTLYVSHSDRRPQTTDRGQQTATLLEKPTTDHRSLFTEALAFILPAAAWFAFAALYFGSLIPHSILAKSLAYHLPDTAALTRLLQHYTTPFLGHLTFGVPWIGVGMIIYPFFFAIGGHAALVADRRLWPWIAYPWLYFAAFAIANPLIFRWYLTPPLPAYIFFILVGMESFIRTITKSRDVQTGTPGWRARMNILLLPLVILFPLALTLRGWTLRPDHGPGRPAPEMAWFELELLYRQAAQILSNEIGDHPTSIPVLAAGDVGVLGFYTPARILDTVGLNSPQALAYYPLDESYYTINYAVPPDLIFDQAPDYLVLLETYGRKGLFVDPRFEESYTLLHKIPTDIYGSDGMLIFKRTP